MGRSELPGKKEFDKIVEEAFSANDCHSFSPQYKQKKDEIQRGIIMKKTNNKLERVLVGTAAAAILAVVAVPTGVVLKNKLSSDDTVAGTDENAVVVEATKASEEITEPAADADTVTEFNEEPKTYVFNWLPEDMTSDGWKLHNSDRTSCITPEIYRYTPDQNLLPRHNFPTASTDEYTVEDKSVKIFYSCDFRTIEENNFGRNVWITFEDSQYAVFLFVSDGFDDEELKKVIENISLAPTDEDHSQIYEEPVQNEQPANNNGTVPVEIPEGIPYDDVNFIALGETFNDTFDFWEDHTTVMDVTVTDAYITRSLDGIATNEIGLDADYSKYTDENGNVIDCYKEWYKNVRQSDGNYTKEVVGDETVGSKILVVDVTYTNNSEMRDEYNVHPTLMTNVDGKLLDIDEAERIERNSEYSCYCNLWEMSGDRSSAFSLSVNGTKGSKNSVSLEPGESAEVRLAFLLREDEIGNGLFLSLRDQGYSTDDESYDFESGILDLSEITER